MAPGRGGRGGRGAPEETVVVDGKTLRRVFDEASKRWVYRPVDEASGETISKDVFEARRREEEAARRASDPRHRAAEEKKWLEQQRGEIREKRLEASRLMRREEHHAALRDGRVERRRPRRKGALAEVPVPDALAELREEMRLATLHETKKKNPGRFAFIETALKQEERKHETKVEAARRRAYAAERRRRGVRGGGGEESTSETDSDDEQAARENARLFARTHGDASFVLRGSAADLDDPDYRRGPPKGVDGAPGAIAGGVDEAESKDMDVLEKKARKPRAESGGGTEDTFFAAGSSGSASSRGGRGGRAEGASKTRETSRGGGGEAPGE
jgi:hypothetical protein